MVVLTNRVQVAHSLPPSDTIGLEDPHHRSCRVHHRQVVNNEESQFGCNRCSLEDVTRQNCRTSSRLAHVCFYEIHGATFITDRMKKIVQVVVFANPITPTF